MSDIEDVAQLVLLERQGRGRGWRQQMRECYAPDAQVRLSWFRGTGADFVSQSEAMRGRGDTSVHRLSPPAVHVHNERALVEMPASIEVHTDIDGTEADLVSYTRLLYGASKRSGTSLIVFLDPIYERDILQPTIPGTHLDVDSARLAPFRRSYRFLAYHLQRRGYEVRDDLYGDAQPEAVTALYDERLAWLND